jgi:hypothetical protein
VSNFHDKHEYKNKYKHYRKHKLLRFANIRRGSARGAIHLIGAAGE